jgi:hypothetical protein
MRWGSVQDADLLEYYKRLIHLRTDLHTLKTGRIQIVEAGRDKLAYTRGDEGELLIVLNLSTKKQKVDTLTQWDQILLQTNTDDVQVRESGITIAPLGGAILSKRT